MTSARTTARKATQRDARRMTRGAVPAALRDATRRDARRITRGAMPLNRRQVEVGRRIGSRSPPTLLRSRLRCWSGRFVRSRKEFAVSYTDKFVERTS